MGTQLSNWTAQRYVHDLRLRDALCSHDKASRSLYLSAPAGQPLQRAALLSGMNSGSHGLEYCQISQPDFRRLKDHPELAIDFTLYCRADRTDVTENFGLVLRHMGPLEIADLGGGVDWSPQPIIRLREFGQAWLPSHDLLLNAENAGAPETQRRIAPGIIRASEKRHDGMSVYLPQSVEPGISMLPKTLQAVQWALAQAVKYGSKSPILLELCLGNAGLFPADARKLEVLVDRAVQQYEAISGSSAMVVADFGMVAEFSDAHLELSPGGQARLDWKLPSRREREVFLELVPLGKFAEALDWSIFLPDSAEAVDHLGATTQAFRGLHYGNSELAGCAFQSPRYDSAGNSINSGRKMIAALPRKPNALDGLEPAYETWEVTLHNPTPEPMIVDGFLQHCSAAKGQSYLKCSASYKLDAETLRFQKPSFYCHSSRLAALARYGHEAPSRVLRITTEASQWPASRLCIGRDTVLIEPSDFSGPNYAQGRASASWQKALKTEETKGAGRKALIEWVLKTIDPASWRTGRDMVAQIRDDVMASGFSATSYQPAEFRAST